MLALAKTKRVNIISKEKLGGQRATKIYAGEYANLTYPASPAAVFFHFYLIVVYPEGRGLVSPQTFSFRSRYFFYHL